MSWGCKPENNPNGCGWSNRLDYPRMGLTEWWCDLCERAGNVLRPPESSTAPTNQDNDPSKEPA